MKILYYLILSCAMLFALELKPGEQLAKNQNFVFNAGSAPVSLDPAKIEGVPEGHFARNLFETLVISDENDKIIPAVALRWSSSEDKKTWTFELRKDARWSNGDNVTAHDFVYAWQRLVDPKTASPYASYLGYMKLKNVTEIVNGKLSPSELGVEAKDDYTLVLHLEESVPFADLLTEFYVLSPVPKKIVEKLGDAWAQPNNIVGNGAFMIKSMVIGEKAELVKNPHYWDIKNVALDKLTLLQIEKPSVSFARYRAGDLDIGEFPLEVLDKIKKELPKELKTAPSLCTYYYDINLKDPVLSNANVRKALSMGLDRDIITDKILRLGQQPAFNFSPPSINAADKITPPEWSKWDANKRHQEAVKLLQQEGYSKQKPLKFTLLYNTNEDHKKIAIAISSMWKKNLDGIIKIELQNLEWKTFLSERRLGNFQLARAGWCSDYNEASTFLNTLLSDSSNNRGRFASKEYDDIIHSAYLAPSQEQRAELYAKAEDILSQETAFIPIYSYVSGFLVKPYVKGFKMKPSQAYYFKYVYILEH